MTATDPETTKARWLEARLELLAEEKALNRRRDELAARRRALPWVPVDDDYAFDGPAGSLTLADLFEGRRQLLVYHFMFGPDWEEGCPSCSFWADGFDGVSAHLAARDTTLVAVSSAPLATLDAYRSRMGWSFPWYSSSSSGFNADFGVTFSAEQQRDGATYNYTEHPQMGEEMPGTSAFIQEDSQIFHTYSTYSRGLDPLNVTYQFLDLTALGRHEDDLEWTMAWLRRHDQYD